MALSDPGASQYRTGSLVVACVLLLSLPSSLGGDPRLGWWSPWALTTVIVGAALAGLRTPRLLRAPPLAELGELRGARDGRIHAHINAQIQRHHDLVRWTRCGPSMDRSGNPHQLSAASSTWALRVPATWCRPPPLRLTVSKLSQRDLRARHQCRAHGCAHWQSCGHRGPVSQVRPWCPCEVRRWPSRVPADGTGSPKRSACR